MVLILPFAFVLFGCSESDNSRNNGKKSLASSEVRIEILGSYYYTGEPIEVDLSNIRVYLDDSNNYINPAQLNISCQNNVEVGIADLIISAKEDSRYVYGTVTVHFEIEPNYQQGNAET